MTYLKTLSCTAMSVSLGRLAATAALAVFSVGAASSAYAADYNYEPELDAMYGQASFGASPVDIRFLPTMTISNSSLLSIDNAAKFDSLTAFGSAAPTVSAFLTKSISYCGGTTDAGIDGCGETPGHILAFEYGVDAVVFAHELGHNFGLVHDNVDPGNIMGANSGFNDRTFTSLQAADILASPLIQTGASGSKYINIQLYDITASVPEPSTGALMGLSGLVLIGVLRKRKTSTSTSATATA